MEHKIVNFETKRVEKDLSQLGAKVADALTLLVDLQQRIEELYLSLNHSDESE